MEKREALKAAETYCKNNGLSLELLATQYNQKIQDSWFFAQWRDDVIPNGLCNDIETQPYPTLIVRADYTVETTEYTEKYLKEE